MPNATAPATKTDCLEDLKRRILRMDLAPGVELDETRLAAEYRLSRTPLREVYQTLAGEGYLQLQKNRGTRVMPMDLTVTRSFFQTAPFVLATMARLAAENRTQSQLAELDVLQDGYAASIDLDDPAESALWDHRFHLHIGEMAHNPYLLPALNRLLIDHTRLSQAFFKVKKKKDKKQVRKTIQQHTAIAEAIALGNAERAANQSLHHWETSRLQMERFVHPDPLPLEVAVQAPV
ncbi:MAG: GntR family transcriptional regulator [Pelagimonas sp.]|jgi:DNA-binding GntR family transcriptional regulator|nr:GntR family transcriptional regulator [Pelagimonas sp.]